MTAHRVASIALLPLAVSALAQPAPASAPAVPGATASAPRGATPADLRAAAMARCRAITDAAERRRCLDRLAHEAPLVPAPR